MRTPILTLLFVTAFAAPALCAQTVLVLPFESRSVAPTLLDSATELMVIYLKDRGLVVHTPADGKRPADVDAAARAVGAGHIVQGRLTRVGRKAIVFSEMRRVDEKVPGWTGRLTAANPEDLEAVLTRMAAGIDAGESVADTLDIHTVTRAEEKRLRRKKANHYFGLNVGGYLPLGAGEDLLSGFGVFWLYDVRTLMFELDFHAFFKDDASRLGLSIGGYYPFSEDDITPYLGGGLEYGGAIVSTGEETRFGEARTRDENGLSAFVGAGMLLGRTNTVAIRADVRYLVSFYEVDGEAAHGPSFSLGLGF